MRSSLWISTTLASVIAAASASADPGFFGTSGLLIAPTAEARPRGATAIGANYVNTRYRRGAFAGSSGTVAQYVALSLLDNVECSAALTNLQGRLGVQRQPLSKTQDGWNVDRSFAVHALVYEGRLGMPSFAVGGRDVFGDAVQNRAFYAVATQPLGIAHVTAGYGTQSLGGVFVGIDAALGPRGRAIAEHVDGNTNFGLRWQLWGGLQADVAMMGGHKLGGGLTWRTRL